jgi:hypothetical protein
MEYSVSINTKEGGMWFCRTNITQLINFNQVHSQEIKGKLILQNNSYCYFKESWD